MDVFIFHHDMLVEMAYVPEWQLLHSEGDSHVFAWPPAFTRKILLPSVCFTHPYSDKLVLLLRLPCLPTYHLPGLRMPPAQCRARVRLDNVPSQGPPTRITSTCCEFTSDLLVNPALKYSCCTDLMCKLTKIFFLNGHSMPWRMV